MIVTKITNIDNQRQINFYNRKNVYNITSRKTADVFVKSSRDWIYSVLDMSKSRMIKKRRYTPEECKQAGVINYIKNNLSAFENMLNFEKLSDENKDITCLFVNNQIRLAERIIAEENNSKQSLFSEVVNGLGSLFSSRYVKSRTEAEYYQNEGKNKFIKDNINNFRAFLYEISKEKPTATVNNTYNIQPQKFYWQEYNELKSKIDSYNEQIKNMPEGEERQNIISKRVESAKALSDFKERAKAEDFSLLEKKDLSAATEEERWNYFKNYAFDLMINNEATALDGMEMFEKYGMRKHIKAAENNPLLHTTLEDLMTAIPKEPSDKLLNRMLDVVDRYSVPNKVNDDWDVYTLRFIFMSEYFRIDKNLSEDTLLRVMNLMKKMELWNTNYTHIPNDIRIKYVDSIFKDSPRVREIKEAVSELEKLCAESKNTSIKAETPELKNIVKEPETEIQSSLDEKQRKFLEEWNNTLG